MKERFHRTLKMLQATESPSWANKSLPLVLLSIRSAYKEDLRPLSAEVLYGTRIPLPGEFFVRHRLAVTSFRFWGSLRHNIRQLRTRQPDLLLQSQFLFLRS